MSFTAEFVEDALSNDPSINEQYSYFWDYLGYEIDSGYPFQINAGLFSFTAEIVKKTVGHEGDYSVPTRMVFKVTNGENTQYFQKTGLYQSYDGTSWDGPFEEVFPRPVSSVEFFTKEGLEAYKSEEVSRVWNAYWTERENSFEEEDSFQ